MGTDYDPPKLETKADDAATDRMLKMLEGEMSKGRQGGVPSSAIDMMMSEIAQISTNMVQGRKDMLSGATQVSEVADEEVKKSEDKKESGKARRQRLHDAKRAKKKKKENEWTQGT